MKNPGCLRKILIAIILFVSISSAFLYFSFTRGMYDGEEQEFDRIVIENADVFRGIDNSHKIEKIVIRGEIISCIGDSCDTPDGAKVIDAKRMAALSGLIDLGVQYYTLSAEDKDLSGFDQFVSFTQQRPEVRKNLHQAGITSIRSVGDAPQNILVLREQINSGKLAGPRIYAAGLMITAPGGHPASTTYVGNDFMLQNGVRLIDGPNSVAETLEELQELEVDGIKIVYKSFGGKYPILKKGELEALIQQAEEKQLWVSVLTGSNQELQTALSLGATCIEGGSGELLDTASIRLLREKEALYLPSLSALDADTAALRIQLANVRLLHQAGVRIGVGTDVQAYQRFGKNVLRELQLLAEGGIPASSIIKSASLEAAIALKKDDILGSLEVGKLADIILTKGSPWENIEDLKGIQHLIQGGTLVMENGKLID